MALDTELVLYRKYEWTEKREFRCRQRNLEMILSLGRACVKTNQNYLLSDSPAEGRDDITEERGWSVLEGETVWSSLLSKAPKEASGDKRRSCAAYFDRELGGFC
jgi:hypothetical protein